MSAATACTFEATGLPGTLSGIDKLNSRIVNGTNPSSVIMSTGNTDASDVSSTLLQLSSLHQNQQNVNIDDDNINGNVNKSVLLLGDPTLAPPINRSRCMFEPSYGETASTTGYQIGSQQGVFQPTNAQPYFSLEQVSSAFANWSSLQQSQHHGSNTSVNSVTSNHNIGHEQRIPSTADPSAISAEASNTTSAIPSWNYPAMLLVQDGYCAWNNNNNDNVSPANNTNVKFWQLQHQTEPPGYQTTPNGLNCDNKGPDSTAPLHYDHEPTFANLTPFHRMSAATSGSNNRVSVLMEPQPRNADMLRNSDASVDRISNSFNQHQFATSAYMPQSLGQLHGNDIRSTNGSITSIPKVTHGSDNYGNVSNSLIPDANAGTPPWYGGATLQPSLSAPSLLINSLSDQNNKLLMPKSAGPSLQNIVQQHHRQQQLINGSNWSLTTSSSTKSAASQYQPANGKAGQDQSSDSNKKMFSCYICSKAYARPSTLRMHMRIHSGIRPYHCRICSKSFCQSANLSAHLRTHNGDKPFDCPICQRKFSQTSSVKTHMRVHTGQRPYKCQACSKTFSDSSTLAKHRRTHNGDRPYMCSVCYLRFTQSGNLNRHMRIHRTSQAASTKEGY